jgi:UPF0755 protein
MFGRRKDVSASPPEAAPLGAPSFARVSPRSPGDALKPIAPPPPPRIRPPRGGLLSTLSSLLTLAVVVALGILIGVSGVDRQAGEPGPLAEDKVVLIPRNMGRSDIAALLKREGVIERPYLFELYALLNQGKGQLKAGEFQFKARTSVEGAIATLIEGKSDPPFADHPEGLTSEQIVARFARTRSCPGRSARRPARLTDAGHLPDRARHDAPAARQPHGAAQREALNAVWAKRSPEVPIKTPQELVILASIVEKETGKGDERPAWRACSTTGSPSA